MRKVKSKEKQQKTILKYIASLVFMIFILFITFKLMLKDTSLDDIANSLLQANPKWVAAGFGLMLVYLLAWAEVFRVMIIHLFKLKPMYISYVNTAAIGFYFNNITPSSSGGQPMQLLYLHSCGINLARASILFIANTVFNNIVIIFYASLVLIVQNEVVSSNLHKMRYLLYFGYFINGGLLLLMLGASFFPEQLKALATKIFQWLVKKKVIKQPAKYRRKLDDFFVSYSSAASKLIHSPVLLVRLLLLHLIQFAAYNFVPYTACMALGATGDILWPSFSLQAILFLATSGFPTPGAVGITEGGFVAMFRNVLPAGKVESAMILTRVINFYAFLILCAILSVLAFVFAPKVKAKLFPQITTQAKFNQKIKEGSSDPSL